MRQFQYVLLMLGFAVLVGCGGSGGGGTAMMPTPTPTPTPTPPPTCVDAPDDPNCTGSRPQPTPTELTEKDMAFVRGIVNPSVADDPTTSRSTIHVSRPGQSVGEQLAVTPGGMAVGEAVTDRPNQYIPPAHKPLTQIGSQNIDAADSPFKALGREGTLGSFISQTYEKKTRGLTDTVTLFSNREDPKAVDYVMYYGGATGTADQNRPAVASIEAGVLTIETTDAVAVATHGSLFQASRFPTASGTKTYGGAVNLGDSDRILPGSFNGIDGNFECTTETCMATATNGVLSSLAGTWTFTPNGDVKTLKVQDAQYDSDYLSFGYWISETVTASGSRFEVGTLHDGSEPMNIAITGLTGTATYVGEAAGAYARKGDNPAVGEFTGHANLTANFDNGVANLGTISGTISQLVDGGEAIDPSWTVDLQTANIVQDGTGPATFDGQTPRGGNWRGEFFGVPAAGTTAENAAYPLGAAGDFIGHFENGHVIGAFGATRR